MRSVLKKVLEVCCWLMSIEVVGVAAQKMFEDELDIPEGVEVEVLDEKTIRVKGRLGSVTKSFNGVPVIIEKRDSKIKLTVYRKGRKGYALINTIKNRIKNLFTGVEKGYTYKMRVYYIHFPMQVSVEGDQVVIKNFAGERGNRYAKILPGVKVEVVKSGGDTDIIIKGVDKDAVGQTAANIYHATKIKNKDPRVFLDGIYLYYKGEGM